MSDMSNAGLCLWSHSTHHHSVFLEVIFDTSLSGVTGTVTLPEIFEL